MTNSLKLIIESIRIAMDKVIDKISWTNLKDKPFYESTQEVILVDSLTSENYGNEDVENPKCNFVPDATYKVIWNVEVYDNLVCYFDGEYNIIASNDNGCPFYIDDDGGNGLYIESDNEDELWTVSIIEYKKEVHKIDEKYLPDMGAKSWNDLEDKPFSEEIKFIEVLPSTTVDEDYDSYYGYSASIQKATYELGKMYTIEINGLQEEFEFVAVKDSSSEHYQVGFNIKDNDGSSDVSIKDTGKKFAMCHSNTLYSEQQLSVGFIRSTLDLYVNDKTSITFPAIIRIFESEPKTVVNYLNPKYIKDMYYEEHSTTNIEGLEYIVCPKILSNGSYFPHDFIIPLEVGQKYNVYYQNHDVLYDTCEVRMGADGICYLGTPERDDYPFYITPTFTRLNSSWVNAMGVSRVKIVGVSGVITGESKIHHLDPKYIKDMYGEETTRTNIVPETSIVLEEDNGYTGNLQSSLRLEAGKEYIITIDGTQYNAIGKLAEEFGVPYLGNGSMPFGMEDTGEIFFVAPFEHPYDTILGIMINSDIVEHTVSIDRIDTEIKHIDPKYIKDMYYDSRHLVSTKPVTVSGTCVWGYMKVADTIDFDLNKVKSVSLNTSTGLDFVDSLVEIREEIDGFFVYNFDFDDTIAMYFPTQEAADVYWGDSENNPFGAGLYIYCDAGNDEQVEVTYSFTYEDGEVNTIESKYIKDMYYDNGITDNELVPEITLLSDSFEEWEEGIYGCRIESTKPISLNQNYTVVFDGVTYELESFNDDGLVAIGAPHEGFANNTDYPFNVSASADGNNYIAVNENVNHTISITEHYHDFKQLDMKYLPIMEEAFETVVEIDEIENDTEINDPSYKPILGKHRVTIDGNSEIVEFITDGYECWYECAEYVVALWDGGLFFGYGGENENPHSVKIERIKNVVKEEHLPDSVNDWNALKNKPFGEEPEKWTQAELINDDWSGRATCKLSSTPIEWAEDNSYKIRVDGVIYEFDGMGRTIGSNATENKDVYYIGATYAAFNKNMNFSEYPFCLLTTDFTNIYVVFEDATLNHTVEFFASEAKITYLNSKFIKDMYYEEKDYTAVLSYAPSTYSDDTLYYRCTADEIVSFRELLDNNSEITVGIGETLYTLEFRGMSSGYYKLYYNDSLVFEYYMGNTNRQINFYYKNLGLSSTPEDIEITFYKQDTLIHYIDPKYIKDMYYEDGNMTLLKEKVYVNCVNNDTYGDVACYEANIYAYWLGGWDNLIDKTIRIIFDDNPYDILITRGHEMGSFKDGLPFALYETSDRVFFYTKESGEHTFEFYLNDIHIKQIDEKYIPDTIARKEYVDKAISNITGTTPGGSNQDFVVTVTSTVTDGVTTYTADKSYEEIKSNVDNGIEVSVKLAAQRYQLQADTGVAYIFGNTLITYDMPFIAQISIKNDNTVMYTMKSTQVSNMSSAISAADDNSKYPSNKAVVDYTVAKNQGVDNAGKVMVVGDDGLVAAEELPVQEQAIFCIILTGDKQNGYVTDKSYDEILEAYNNGKACLMYYNVNVAGVLIIDTIYALYEKSQNILKFRWTEVSNNGAVSTMFQISSDNQVSEFNYQFSQSTFATKNTNSTLNTTDKTLVGAINEVNEQAKIFTTFCSYDVEWDEYIADKSFDEIAELINKGNLVLLKPNDIDIFICGAFLQSHIVFYHIGLDTLNPSYDSADMKIRYAIMSKETDNIVMFNSKYINFSNFLDIRGTYSELSTEDKYIIGAINELNAKHTEGTDSLILLSPNGTRFSITVGDDGVLSATEITE